MNTRLTTWHGFSGGGIRHQDILWEELSVSAALQRRYVRLNNASDVVWIIKIVRCTGFLRDYLTVSGHVGFRAREVVGTISLDLGRHLVSFIQPAQFIVIVRLASAMPFCQYFFV